MLLYTLDHLLQTDPGVLVRYSRRRVWQVTMRKNSEKYLTLTWYRFRRLMVCFWEKVVEQKKCLMCFCFFKLVGRLQLNRV